MRGVRHAARTDGNQADIVKALRRVGAVALYIGKPVDLLVGFRGRNYLMELKDPNAARGPGQAMQLTAAEKEFMDTWPGQVLVVTSPEDAVAALVEAGRPFQP